MGAVVLTQEQKDEALSIMDDHAALLLLMNENQILLESKLILRKSYIKEAEVLKSKNPRNFPEEIKINNDIKTISTTITELETLLAPHTIALKNLRERSANMYKNIQENNNGASNKEITEALKNAN